MISSLSNSYPNAYNALYYIMYILAARAGV